MLEVVISYENVFSSLKQREGQYACLPTSEQWKFAKDVCGRLNLFNVVTELFSATKHPTANIYFSKICEIKLALHKWVSSSNELIQKMVGNMLLKFDKYWGTIHEIMGVATVLDPRYKMELLEYYYEKMYGIDSFSQVRKIRQLSYNLVSDYQLNMRKDSYHSSTNLDGHKATSDSLFDYDRYTILNLPFTKA